jgi:hypothetical protein
MSLVRWAITIVGFPVGGFLAIQFVSIADGPLAAAVAGLIAGAVIGTAQWLALHPVVTPWWIAATAGGMGAGLALGSIVTDSATSTGSLIVTGAIAGALVGLAQGLLVKGGPRRALVWAVTVGSTWAAGWAITTLVIVDQQRGYAVFGLSGALLVTIVTGLVLKLVLGARPARIAQAA